MTGLDTLLQEAAKSGLLGFTLYQAQDGSWQASTTRDKLGWQVTIDADPIVAVRRALSALSEKKTDNTDAEDIFS